MKDTIRGLSMIAVAIAGLGLSLSGVLMLLSGKEFLPAIILMAVGWAMILAIGIPLLIHVLREEKRKEREPKQ